MNITINKKEKELHKPQIKTNKVMPKGLTLYFESFTTDQMKTFIISSSDEIKVNLLIALINVQTERLSTITISREKEWEKREFEDSSKGFKRKKNGYKDNILDGESGKAKTKSLRDKLNSFNHHEIKEWTNSLLFNISVKLKRNLIWIEENADKIALKKEKKAARERARRIERGGTGKMGRRKQK